MENKSAALQETPYDEIKSFFDSAPPLRDGVSISKKFQQFIETKSSSSGDSRNKRYFLKAGYSVIFLYRRGSYQPYCTSLPDDPLLECLELTDESSIQVHPSHSDAVKKAIAEHQAAVKGGHLLKLPFTTIFEYLQILRSISISMKTVDRSAMFYLAAAMFGFYVPWDSMLKLAQTTCLLGDLKLASLI